jgi:hypothetical protein
MILCSDISDLLGGVLPTFAYQGKSFCGFRSFGRQIFVGKAVLPTADLTFVMNWGIFARRGPRPKKRKSGFVHPFRFVPDHFFPRIGSS